MKDEVMSIKGSITSYIHKCNGLQKQSIQLYASIQKIGYNKELCLIASIKCEHIIQQALAVMRKSDMVLTVQGMSRHNVRIPSDSSICSISDICVLPDGQVLVADIGYTKVKLLDQQFQVVSHFGVADTNRGMCQIANCVVAVAVDDNGGTIHEVQFITVKESQFVAGRKLHLQRICKGLAHHQGDLYISSNTAMYKYSLSGKLVCRLYEDLSGALTVWGCALSPRGDNVYVTNWSHHKLLTLAMDGSVMATFTDSELISPAGVPVTPAGQVLVCGYSSKTILQVDSEGRMKLATLATRERDRVWRPWSVCYSSITFSIIVGKFRPTS